MWPTRFARQRGALRPVVERVWREFLRCGLLEHKANELLQKFPAAVAIGTRILGPPVFKDGVGRAGFPEDQDAVRLALWPSGNSRLMIEHKHEDKELPIRLSIVVAPPA